VETAGERFAAWDGGIGRRIPVGERSADGAEFPVRAPHDLSRDQLLERVARALPAVADPAAMDGDQVNQFVFRAGGRNEGFSCFGNPEEIHADGW